MTSGYWPFAIGVLFAGAANIAQAQGIPLTRNGPIANLNNDFRLMIGAQAYFSVTPIPYIWISAPVTVQWNFYLSDQWSVLLEAGLAVDVFAYDLINCYDQHGWSIWVGRTDTLRLLSAGTLRQSRGNAVPMALHKLAHRVLQPCMEHLEPPLLVVEVVVAVVVFVLNTAQAMAEQVGALLLVNAP
jgi:hypothetical protein